MSVVGAVADVCHLTAAERLSDAENTASNDQRRAQKDSHSYRSSIYPAGSEFALVRSTLAVYLPSSIIFAVARHVVDQAGILASSIQEVHKLGGCGSGFASLLSLRITYADLMTRSVMLKRN